MKRSVNVDSNGDPLNLDTMTKYQQYIHYLKMLGRSVPRRYHYPLITSFFLSTIFFFIMSYSNSQFVHGFFARLLSLSPITNDNLLTLPNIQGLSTYDQNSIYTDFNYLNNSSLTFETRTYSKNVEVLFRLPRKIPIVALLLIFHGCSRSAHDWFSTVERQRIIGAAIDLGYGCLAFQSTDDFSRCWSNEVDLASNPDAQMVSNGLDGFYKEYPKLKSLPRFTFGASSGGMFSSVFAINPRYPIQGQIIFISIVLPELLQTHVKAGKYPPTAWIYMTRDTEFASEVRINDSMKVFAKQNIPHISYAIRPISVTSTTFHDRIPTITKETSQYIFTRLQQHQWLDSQNYLKHNPRRKNTWPDFLSLDVNKIATSASVSNNLEQHRSVLPDFLNTIYGEHEISFERSFEALQWHQRISNNHSSPTTSSA